MGNKKGLCKYCGEKLSLDDRLLHPFQNICEFCGDEEKRLKRKLYLDKRRARKELSKEAIRNDKN